MIKLATLWERTSARGQRYFSGFLGDAQLLLFDAGERDHPTRPGEKIRVWKLMVTERDQDRRPAPKADAQERRHDVPQFGEPPADDVARAEIAHPYDVVR